MEILLKYFSDFTETQLIQFEALENLYKEWNSKINVISRKDIDGLYLKHVLHSLAIAPVVDFQPGVEVLDIGSGGGFPGIPLAIFFPEVKFHLIDSIAKKVKVMDEVSKSIGLSNVITQHVRVEEIKNRRYDFVVTRAVAPLKTLWQWSFPLIKKGHQHEFANGLLCLKGGDLSQEIFESGLRPQMMPVEGIFSEEYFHEKYLLHVSK